MGNLMETFKTQGDFERYISAAIEQIEWVERNLGEGWRRIKVCHYDDCRAGREARRKAAA